METIYKAHGSPFFNRSETYNKFTTLCAVFTKLGWSQIIINELLNIKKI